VIAADCRDETTCILIAGVKNHCFALDVSMAQQGAMVASRIVIRYYNNELYAKPQVSGIIGIQRNFVPAGEVCGTRKPIVSGQFVASERQKNLDFRSQSQSGMAQSRNRSQRLCIPCACEGFFSL